MDKIRKRCPNGTRKNPKTGKCVNVKKSKIQKQVKKTMKKKKVCPPEKPLYNPETNRCIKNTALNRKKLGLVVKPVVKPTPKADTLKTYMVDKCPPPFYEDIDLNKIKVDTKSPSIQLDYKVNNNKTVKLYNTKILGSGTYGQVLRMSDISNKYNVALKIFYKENDNELLILENLEKNKVDCNILACKRLKTKDNEVVVCDLYSNSLVDILNPKFNLTFLNKVLIIKQIANDLLCLLDKGFAYTDIKLDNVLYKCLNNNRFKVVLGDIGSICLNKKVEEGITTYPPWEYRTKAAHTMCDDKQIVWGVGVLSLCLLLNNPDPYPFYWRNLKNVSVDYIKKSIYDYIKSPKIDNFIINTSSDSKIKLSTLLYNMLRLDPNDRLSLKGTVTYLNFIN